MKDTVYHGCGNSVEFMEEYTGIEAMLMVIISDQLGLRKEI